MWWEDVGDVKCCRVGRGGVGLGNVMCGGVIWGAVGWGGGGAKFWIRETHVHKVSHMYAEFRWSKESWCRLSRVKDVHPGFTI